LLDPVEGGGSMTIEELVAATGLTARDIGDLERFGMIASRSLGSTTYYDQDAVLVAQLAAGFRSHGVEARHLRMYRVAAEREAGVFEQLLTPLARKRSPSARRQSAELVNELAALGDGLRSAMLRQLLREYVDGV
jgi:DNA-binding transcriptional MerR regulator